MNEFGETPAIYVWPIDHEEGEPFPDDFWERIDAALKAVGVQRERV